MYPKCFDSQKQYDEWKDADYRIFQSSKTNKTPFCTDCTPSYAAQMRLEGRCEHPEIQFVRFKGAFMGDVEGRRSMKYKEFNEKWEKVNVSDAKKPGRHAGGRL